MATIKINRSVTILFEWMGRTYKRTLLRKNFCEQLDRFYANFYLGKDLFYFEDDLEDGQPVLVMPGVWMQPNNDREDAQYYWHPSVLKVCRIDGRPIEIINNGR